MRSDYLSAVLISDDEYPQRVAFTLLSKILDEYKIHSSSSAATVPQNTVWLDDLLFKVNTILHSFSLAPEPQLHGHSALRVARCVGACNNHIMWFGYTRYCCVRYGLQFYTSRSIERIGFCREEFWKNLTQRQRKVHFF